MDLIAKAQPQFWGEDDERYSLRMNLDLDSMKTFIRSGCNHYVHTSMGSWGLLDAQVMTSHSSCIATKLADAEIQIFKFDGPINELRWNEPDEKDKRWVLVDTLPIKWE